MALRSLDECLWEDAGLLQGFDDITVAALMPACLEDSDSDPLAPLPTKVIVRLKLGLRGFSPSGCIWHSYGCFSNCSES